MGFYNYFMNQISKTDRNEDQQCHNSQADKSKAGALSQFTELGQPFQVELTVCQAHAIQRLLPIGYSIQIQRATIAKRIVKRISFHDAKNYKSMHQGSQDVSPCPIADEPASITKISLPGEDFESKSKKILNLLNKHKSSWPFRQPVDPIELNLPHYFQIIKNPMDLLTVSQNLKAQKYVTISQFYADIYLIISNSYKFNENNAQFREITSGFEKYFERLKDGSNTRNLQNSGTKKNSRSNKSVRKVIQSKSMNQLAQRKELAMNLKYLPKQELANLIRSMSEVGELSYEVNLETLSSQKVKFLQNYLIKKQSTVKSKEEIPAAGQESCFQSDSDSC